MNRRSCFIPERLLFLSPSALWYNPICESFEKGNEPVKFRWFWVVLLLLLLCPVLAGADVSWGNKSWPEDAEYIDLDGTVVTDFDAFEAFLDQLPNLKQVDMWANKMSKAQCDRLAARYPDMKWGWTMVIRAWDHEHLVRTDYTAFSTLHNNRSGKHSSEDFSVLRYCWNLKALDIGHNKVDNIDFLYDLPELRVLIIAINNITDITPLASLKHLEYAELFNNKITDITPLQDLPHLLDLNLSFNRIKDLSPVMNLKTLQRLWLFSSQQIKQQPAPDIVAKIKAALPDTQIDTYHHPTTGTWRYIGGNRKHPHYAVITQMFGEDHLHPRYEYVPFDESWTDEGTHFPEYTPSPFEEAPSLELLKPQDFSDRNYLLPVDFTPGSVPKRENYSGENAYSDSTISVKTGKGNTGSCEYWFAEIKLTDASQFRTMAASNDGSFTRTGQMNALRFAEHVNPVIAINGDYWDSREKRGMGYIVRQGILYQNNLAQTRQVDSMLMDILLVDEDGDFTVLQQPTAGEIPGLLNGKRVLNAFSFGPILVQNGEAVKNYHQSDFWLDMAADKPRQRMCICQTGPLQYLVLCCAGPYKDNTGMTLNELGELAASLGAQTAYNLDGGYSTMLYFKGQQLNLSGNTKPRALMDIIYFASAE